MIFVLPFLQGDMIGYNRLRNSVGSHGRYRQNTGRLPVRPPAHKIVTTENLRQHLAENGFRIVPNKLTVHPSRSNMRQEIRRRMYFKHFGYSGWKK